MSYKIYIFSFSSVVLMAWGGISGYVYYEESKKEKFLELFPSWFHDRLSCTPNLGKDRSLLFSLSPNLIRRIDVENANMKTVFLRNKDGDMSVADLLNLERSGHKMVSGHKFQLVNVCEIEGFIFNSKTQELRYCEKNISVSLLHPNLLGGFLNHSQAQLLVRGFYNSLKQSNNITEFLNDMQVVNASKLRRFEEYSRVFDQLPAAQFSGLTKSEIQAARQQYKLEQDIDYQCNRYNIN
jgi:hypothetical protein